MQPIGPAPVMSTSSPTRSNESAVCTALPNGSKQESTSSGIDGSACQQLSCGIATNSAQAPGRFTPTPWVLGQRCRRPGEAIAAVSTGDVSLAHHQIAARKSFHVVTDSINDAGKLMTDGHRHWNGFLRPVIPVVDVHVSTADRRLQHPDQNVIAPNFWNQERPPATDPARLSPSQRPSSFFALVEVIQRFRRFTQIPQFALNSMQQ